MGIKFYYLRMWECRLSGEYKSLSKSKTFRQVLLLAKRLYKIYSWFILWQHSPACVLPSDVTFTFFMSVDTACCFRDLLHAPLEGLSMTWPQRNPHTYIYGNIDESLYLCCREIIRRWRFIDAVARWSSQWHPPMKRCYNKLIGDVFLCRIVVLSRLSSFPSLLSIILWTPALLRTEWSLCNDFAESIPSCMSAWLLAKQCLRQSFSAGELILTERVCTEDLQSRSASLWCWTSTGNKHQQGFRQLIAISQVLSIQIMLWNTNATPHVCFC